MKRTRFILAVSLGCMTSLLAGSALAQDANAQKCQDGAKCPHSQVQNASAKSKDCCKKDAAKASVQNAKAAACKDGSKCSTKKAQQVSAKSSTCSMKGEGKASVQTVAMNKKCPDCKDGKACDKCKAKKAMHASFKMADCKDGKMADCKDCKDGKACDKCKAKKAMHASLKKDGCKDCSDAMKANCKDGEMAKCKDGSECKSKAGTIAVSNMTADAAFQGTPYLLNTCAVSKEVFENGDEPIVRVFEGRQFSFCCKKCVKKFQENPDKYIDSINERIVAAQMPYYSTTKCLVSDEELGDDATNFVYNNRLIRFCCNDCKKEFKADPTAYLAKLDKTLADTQRTAYPLKACTISKNKLGGMGDPYEMVVGNRLIRFCCSGCLPTFNKNPAKFIAMVDAAWKGNTHENASTNDSPHDMMGGE